MGLFDFSSATTSSGPTIHQKREMSSKQLVEDAIASNDMVVFSKTWCGYSSRAKALANQVHGDKSLKVIELDLMEEGDEVQSYLLSKTGQRTVPSVWINQQHIGGNDDFQAANRQGRVKKLLADSGKP